MTDAVSDPNQTRAAALDAALADTAAADAAVGGPQARAATGMTGSGIRIGILSDSYDLLGGAGPAATILKEGPAGSTDEGRALADLIHTTAPGAQLFFYSAQYSEQDFANGIAALAAQGCQVIVDDVAYEDESFFQLAGPIDLAVQQAVAQGVSYFTAAGNDGIGYDQGAFTPVAGTVPGLGTGTFEQFPGGNLYQTVTIQAGRSVVLSLQWSAPYNAANPDTLAVTAVSTGNTVIRSAQSGQRPVDLLFFPMLQTAQTYRIYITQQPGTVAPSEFKYVLEGFGGAFTGSNPGVGTGSGTILGHGLVPGVNAVGAVNVGNTPAEGGVPVPDTYSSTGPGQLLFDQGGKPLAQPQTLAAPAFLAPDGAATTVFDPFIGTSAAAAEAAAAAALVLQADPALSHGDVSTLLADSAIPAGAPGAAGAGLIQASTAVSWAASRQIFGSPQAVVTGLSVPCTVAGGTGTHEVIAGSGPALLGSEGTDDTVIAGAGADTVDLTGASALLFGAGGPLVVRDLGGADTVAGGAGGVTVAGGAGGGVEYGGAAGGNALTAGAEPTLLVGGGPGDMLAAAGAGNDTLVAGGAGAATLTGGAATGGSVFVAGGTGARFVAPGAGNSAVYLGSGAATVVGGSGRMVLAGAAGPALAFGGTAGGNELVAGSGAATLVGGGAADTLVGGGAGDLLVAANGGNDSLFGGTGQETLAGSAAGTDIFVLGRSDAVVAPEAAAAVVALGSGQSTVVGGSGNTLYNVVAGQAGGTDFITGFNPAEDAVRLAGYGAAAAAAMATQYDAGGNTWVALPDGTLLAFIGLGHLSMGSVVVG